MTLTPFTFADNILSSREDILTEENIDQYNPFIINRHLSYFPDVVHYSNDMNQFAFLSKATQYHYYLNTIPKRKRFSRWEKKSSDQVVEAIARYFQCNQQRAEEFSMLMPDDVKQKITNEMGLDNGKRNTKPGRGKAKAS